MDQKEFRVFINPHRVPFTLYEPLKKNAEIKIGEIRRYEEQEMVSECRDVHAILSTILAPVTRTVIENATNLKVIAQQGIGVDHIDVKTASDRNILVTYAPLVYHAAAEHAIALIVSWAKQIPLMQDHVKSGGWRDEAKYRTCELFGKTMGIVGLGRIGFWVARKMQGWGMQVLAYDPYVPVVSTTEQMFEVMGIRLVDLDTLLQESDFVTIHTALTPETKGMIGEKELRKMKTTAFLVNTARASIVNESSLYEALKNGWIAGAGLDVFEEEPLRPSNPFVALNNVIFTPHIAGRTPESLERVVMAAVEDVNRVFRGKDPIYGLNLRRKAK